MCLSQSSPQSFNFVPSAVASRLSPTDNEAGQKMLEGPKAQAHFGSSSSFPHYTYHNDDDSDSQSEQANSTRKEATLANGQPGAPDIQWGVPWLSGMANAFSQPFSQTKDNGRQQTGEFENMFSFGRGGNAKQ